LKYFILFLFVLITSSVSAAEGCVLTSSKAMYTSRSGMSENFNDTNPPVPLGTGCIWIFVAPSTDCNVKIGSGPGQPGKLASTIQECDIDTNAFILLFGSIGFGAFMLRKKREANFSSK